MRRLCGAFFACGCLCASAIAAQAPGDEPISVTHHDVTVGGRTMHYTARAGRIAIRENETGDVHGQMFFISYTLDQAPGQPPRPLTFAWNGGPGSNAALVNFVGFGPKRVAPQRGADPADDTKRWIIEPNPGTWLDETDLVFVDPIGTGYSRVVRAEYGPEFYQTRGDAESVAEFIRVYRTRYDAHDAPLFLAGESYGVTRAAGVAEALERRGTTVRGVVMLSLELPLGTMSDATRSALELPTLAAAAFVNHKLAPDLQRDLTATLKQVESWAETDYARALARRDSLSAAEKDSVVRVLSRFTGLDASLIDRRTLVVTRMQVGNYLLRTEGKFVGQYDSRKLAPLDTAAQYDVTRDPSLVHQLDAVTILRYMRNDLGYKSDLRYQGPWGGSYPPPTTFRGDWMSPRWNRPVAAGAPSPEGPKDPLRLALTANPSMRVMIACGVYDLICDYFGNEWIVSHLEPALRRNVTRQELPRRPRHVHRSDARSCNSSATSRNSFATLWRRERVGDAATVGCLSRGVALRAHTSRAGSDGRDSGRQHADRDDDAPHHTQRQVARVHGARRHAPHSQQRRRRASRLHVLRRVHG